MGSSRSSDSPGSNSSNERASQADSSISAPYSHLLLQSPATSQRVRDAQRYVSPYGRVQVDRLQTSHERHLRACPTASSPVSPSASASDAASQWEGNKQSLIRALNERRLNTISELRRAERIFAGIGSEDVSRPMTLAWQGCITLTRSTIIPEVKCPVCSTNIDHSSLLTELRGLTRNYPFSSACLDKAKSLVHQDPASNRSWNYCWLVLAKIHTEKLIPTYAQSMASRDEMWGDHKPEPDQVKQLTQAFIEEWTAALTQLLRFWETAPIR